MTFTPDDAQQAAIDSVARWYRDPTANQVYRLFGYAGTGKTTLARHIAASLGINPAYAAYSGKAASVLRRKGCHGASTIHSLIYIPQEKSREELQQLEAELASGEVDADEWATKIAEARAELLRPEFRINEDSLLNHAPLLILDEVSMVNAKIAADLESFGVRILCLGDPAQLPPVEGGGYYTDALPDTLLTDVHRSALDSPVTRLATAARQSDDPYHGVEGMDGDSGRTTEKLSLSSFDQVIVGTNKTRWNLINRMRKQPGSAPQIGERILTLANNPEADVLNGEQFTVLAADDRAHGYSYQLLVETEGGDVRQLEVWRDGFRDAAGERDAKFKGRRGKAAAATFAHAITAHKAQGSQWGRVLVIDESGVFAWMTSKELREAGQRPEVARAEGAKQARRWFYTALTRASEQVVVKDIARGNR